MKRIVLLILALLLLLDLAEDGCLGKASFVPSHSSAETSVTSPHCYDSGKVDSRSALPSPDYGEMSGLRQLQPVTLRIHPALKIIDYCNTGSSGGIPL